MNRVIKFTVIAKKWWDRVNGNTYHSVRCVRHKDNVVVVGPFQYGYGEGYKQTALEVMVEARWFPKKYIIDSKYASKSKQLESVFMYERKNNYPILWTVSEGLKRDCVENGKL